MEIPSFQKPSKSTVCSKQTKKCVDEERFFDLEEVTITPDDVDDPAVHVQLKDLSTYKIGHLKQWLLYRGDTLQSINTLKDAQLRVLSYINLGTSEIIVDPTPEKKWLLQKAEKLKLRIKPFNDVSACDISCPELFQLDLLNLNQSDGWSKSLKDKPIFTIKNILKYTEDINFKIISKAKI
nr:uncharacterized protein LOC124819169 isoform X2 [Hydra vulgaris]